ncbi:MAG: aminoglycoside phosphotransferase family protein [Balneolaceae bacterium]|nr:aminoglycoside phosphotransferase family protein [Balneolaceae bacterium]MBO6545083.1 aminoglycoside phosphotransferase family protein [Balneolaceae bacterium]MBO6646479.1 aminoglycoside phosphotransferase family protein [Balneolaceae bacterium]
MSFPKADIEITEEFVRALVATQFPEFSDHSVTFLSEGFDNANFRLGDSLMVRLPRRTLRAVLLTQEIEWLPKLEHQLPIPVPAPIKIGKPTDAYPWSWTIVPFFEGNSALHESISESEIEKLVRFLKVLHRINPLGTPGNPYRGVPLSSRDHDVKNRMKELEQNDIAVPLYIKNLWEMAVAEHIDSEPCLIHGDLHPNNIIVKNGEIQAIIDWGDVTKGDPATDLVSFWMLIEDSELRLQAFEAYGASESLIKRSIGWAVFYIAVFLNPDSGYKKLGEKMLSILGRKVI